MKKLAVIFGTLAFSFSVTACNTMQGMGKDIERGGEKVQNTAQDAKGGQK